MEARLHYLTPTVRSVARLTRWQLRYMAYLRKTGGATDHQAAEALNRPLSSINSTRNALKAWVEDSGKTAKSPYGDKPVTVWRLKP